MHHFKGENTKFFLGRGHLGGGYPLPKPHSRPRLHSSNPLQTTFLATGLLSFEKNSNGHYLREGSSDPLHVWFYSGVFWIGGSNDANFDLTKFSRYVGENNARGVIRLVTA